MLNTDVNKSWTYTIAYCRGKDFTQAIKALNLAKDTHVALRKDNVTPEWHHQLNIASYFMAFNLPNNLLENLIVVSALHDIVEDYNFSLYEIEKDFGKDISLAVEILSKITPNGKKPNDCYYEGISENLYASLTKGSDRIHNMATMSTVFNKSKRADYVLETRDYVLPMLKKAKIKFPNMINCYENIKYVLNIQCSIYKGLDG